MRETGDGRIDTPESDRRHDSGLCGAGKQYTQEAYANGRVDLRVAIEAAPQLVGSYSVMDSVGGKVVWRKAKMSAGPQQGRAVSDRHGK
jgi:hypothetical protein